MGDFAQQSLPLNDSVTLVVQRVNESTTDAIQVRNVIYQFLKLIELVH